MNNIIRKATIADVNVLGYIHAESWKMAYKGIIPEHVLDNITVEKRAKRFYNALKEGSEENIIISVEGDPAGFLCLGHCRDEDLDKSHGEIWGIYLLSKYWNKGIGSMLFEHGINQLYDRGYVKVSLWVLEENTQAREFYEKRGFTFDGTVKELDIGRKLNEVRYIKELR